MSAAITPELVAQHQLSPDEYRKIVSILGRVPSYTERGYTTCQTRSTDVGAAHLQHHTDKYKLISRNSKPPF